MRRMNAKSALNFGGIQVYAGICLAICLLLVNSVSSQDTTPQAPEPSNETAISEPPGTPGTQPGPQPGPPGPPGPQPGPPPQSVCPSKFDITADGGSLMYPDSQHYTSGAGCSWILGNQTANMSIKLTLTHKDMADAQDFLDVYSMNGSLIYRITGEQGDVFEEITFPYNELVLYFSSDAKNDSEYTGFQLNFTYVDGQVSEQTSCVSNFSSTSTGGSLTYPTSEDYNEDDSCSWVIGSDDATQSIQLTMDSENMEENVDFLTVYSVQGVPLYRFSGIANESQTVTFPFSKLVLLFTSDGNNQFSGFHLEYTLVAGNGSAEPVCPSNFSSTATGGSLTYPNTGNYSAGVGCSWMIGTADETMSVNVTFVDLNIGDDSLHVYTMNGALLYTISGRNGRDGRDGRGDGNGGDGGDGGNDGNDGNDGHQNMPQSVTFPFNMLVLYFSSENEDMGFHLEYTVVPGVVNSQPACSSNFTVNETGGMLTYSPSEHDRTDSCFWIIEGNSSMPITIELLQSSMEDGYGFLTVYTMDGVPLYRFNGKYNGGDGNGGDDNGGDAGVINGTDGGGDIGGNNGTHDGGDTGGNNGTHDGGDNGGDTGEDSVESDGGDSQGDNGGDNGGNGGGDNGGNGGGDNGGDGGGDNGGNGGGDNGGNGGGNNGGGDNGGDNGGHVPLKTITFQFSQLVLLYTSDSHNQGKRFSLSFFFGEAPIYVPDPGPGPVPIDGGNGTDDGNGTMPGNMTTTPTTIDNSTNAENSSDTTAVGAEHHHRCEFHMKTHMHEGWKHHDSDDYKHTNSEVRKWAFELFLLALLEELSEMLDWEFVAIIIPLSLDKATTDATMVQSQLTTKSAFTAAEINSKISAAINNNMAKFSNISGIPVDLNSVQVSSAASVVTTAASAAKKSSDSSAVGIGVGVGVGGAVLLLGIALTVAMMMRRRALSQQYNRPFTGNQMHVYGQPTPRNVAFP